MSEIIPQAEDVTQPPPLPTEYTEEGIYVCLTHEVLDVTTTLNTIRSPKAGALVLFAGTTRDNFNEKPVVHLAYQSYAPLAIRTMTSIAQAIKSKHELQAIAIVHRLGTVPVGEESVYIAVSSAHRQAAWRAGEEALEEVKDRVEVWKLEEFGGEEGGVWRANRDGAVGEKVA